MTPQQQARAQGIFLSLCDLDPAERERQLNEQCGDDAALRARVQALLDMDASSAAGEGFLETPALGSSLSEFINDKDANLTGGMVASGVSFRLIRPVGEGGMGVVYEAEQSAPRRRVALKLMRQAFPSEDARRRFRYEGELLGRLRHPGIAGVYESGFGRFRLDDRAFEAPFLAMEFIEGATLTAHSSARRLDVRARVELVANICDAVQHAHERGVLHRDLKPGNILVDSAGHPRILDFGVAKAFGGEMELSARLTQSGHWIGTLAYMSPEQVRGEWREIDTRSDVYAIGVILYELLAGKLPLDLEGLHPLEAARRMMEVEPAYLGKTLPSLRGDLTAIVAKALEKDKSRRYASAAALADDLRRYLRGDPILARPPTATYVVRRFVRRNRLLVASVLLTLLGTIGGLTFGLVETRAQRDVAREAESRAIAASQKEAEARRSAEREARIAASVTRFLNEDLLAAVSPDNTPNRDILMRDVLNAAAQKIEGRFPDEPLVEAATRIILGSTFLRLGEYPEAEKHIARAVALRNQHLDDSDPERFESTAMLASLYYSQGRYLDAETQLVELVAVGRHAFSDDHVMTCSALSSLGFVPLQLGKYAEAEPLLVEAAEGMRRLAPDSFDTVSSLVNLATCYGRTDRTEQAIATLKDAVELARSIGRSDHPDSINAMAVLAAIHNQRQEYNLSIPLLVEALEMQSRVLGDDHPQTLMTRSNLGVAYGGAGRTAEAEPVLHAVFEARRRTLGESHPHTLLSHFNIGQLRQKQGRLAEAESIYRHGVEIKSNVPDESHPLLPEWTSALNDVIEEQKKLAERQP